MVFSFLSITKSVAFVRQSGIECSRKSKVFAYYSVGQYAGPMADVLKRVGATLVQERVKVLEKLFKISPKVLYELNGR